MASPSNPGSVQRVLAICGVVAPILSGILVVVAGLLRPSYDPVRQLISELGAGSNAVMQNANQVIFGLLVIAFAFGLNRGISDGKILRIGVGFLIIFGAGVFGSGVFSCDSGCPLNGGSFNNFMHYLVSVIGVTAFVITSLVFWWGLGKDSRWRRYRTYSLITGLVLLVLLFPGVAAFQSSWAGAFERLFVGIADLWIELMAIKLLRLSPK